MSFRYTRRHVVVGGLVSTVAAPFVGGAYAQAWPTKPIKITVGYPPGGATDLYARAYGEYISQKVGQPVLVDNKAGAGGSIAAQAVKSAPADGYNLMFTISTTMIPNRVLYKSLPYDADKDFVLIAYMSAGMLPFVVHKSTGAKTLQDFIDYAKKGKATHGTYAAGSAAHILMAELNRLYGLNVEIVHYRGETPMWQDFNAGVIQSAVGSYQAASAILEAGTGVPVAMWPRRMKKKLSDVPSFTELGVKTKLAEASGFICLVGPAGMPQEIVEKLSDLMVEAGKSERIQKLLDTFAVDDAAAGHAEFKKLYEREKPIWIELVSSLGLTPQ
jgi:tripartite-type tricarboxylate transporter receptor subunit TctC